MYLHKIDFIKKYTTVQAYTQSDQSLTFTFTQKITVLQIAVKEIKYLLVLCGQQLRVLKAPC
jgi:hypothetical protein